MDLHSALTIGRVLFCFAVIGVCMPAAALRMTRRIELIEVAAGLVWTWLAMAVATPLLASVHGVNWLTVFVLAGVWPIGLWLFRHRGDYQRAFNARVRSTVSWAIGSRQLASRWRPSAVPLAALMAILLVGLSAVSAASGLRPATAVDFDTLWRTRELLASGRVWDPMAALTAILGGVASSGLVDAATGLRLGLVMFAAAIAGAAIWRPRGWRRWAAVAVALLVIAMAPLAAASAWAIAVTAVVGVVSLGRWLRDQGARHGWHAVAASALAFGLMAPYSADLTVLVHASGPPQHLAYSEASRQTRALARLGRADSLLVAPPEQRVELEGAMRLFDLSAFVARFEPRASNPSFRFDLPAATIYVLVEKRPFDPPAVPASVTFVSNQPAVYRVPRARADLQRRALALCEGYRSTHAGAAIIYDDHDIRIYRFDQ